MNTLLVSIAVQLLSGNNWQDILENEGPEILEGLIVAKLGQRIEPLDKIAGQMASEGWSWGAASDPEFLKAQKVQVDAQDAHLGPGFVTSRDIVYSLNREAGLKGGELRDRARDELDNAVYEAGPLNPSMTLSQMVEVTAVAWCQVVARAMVEQLAARI